MTARDLLDLIHHLAGENGWLPEDLAPVLEDAARLMRASAEAARADGQTPVPQKSTYPHHARTKY